MLLNGTGAGTDLEASGFSPEGELTYIAGFKTATVANTANCAVNTGGSPATNVAPSRHGGGLDVTDRSTADLCTGTLGGTNICEDSSNITLANFSVPGTAVTGVQNAGSPVNGNPGITARCQDSQFAAAAEGDIGGDNNDVWIMNHAKQLTNPQSGV